MQYIVDSDATVACITESWLTDSTNHVTYIIKSYGYSISHTHRQNKIGGGVCFIYKPNIIMKKINHISTYESFEYHCLEFPYNSNCTNLAIAGIYRKQEISFKQFCTDFHHFCEKVIDHSRKYFLLVGDFNIHFEYDNTQSNRFANLITTFGFSQHVTEATNTSGHTIDLFFFQNAMKPPLIQ